MNIDQLVSEIDELAEVYVSDNFEQIKPSEIGLDNRSTYRLFVSNEGVVGDMHQDGTLQYYGGFEYVEKRCRIVLGTQFVFYSAEDNRVARHLNQMIED